MANYLKSLPLILFLLAAGFSRASAQAGVSVLGTVYDQNGAVISGATVRALNIFSGRERETRTDAGGRYEMAGLHPGLYRVAASSEGFATAARSISLRDAGPLTQNFSLSPGRIEDAITVTAGKGSARVAAETPQPVVIIDALDIEKRRPSSTLQAIETTPNLSQVGTNPASERPRLRGLTSNRLLLVVDGERLNNVRSDPLSGVSPGIIDVTELQAAEVVSGAGSSLYGSDALAGTINLITRQPAQVYAGRYLGLRFDGDLHTNGMFRRGSTTLNLSAPRIALRLGGALFRLSDYTAGDAPIPLEEVVRLGRFANEMGNAAGSNVARTYSVWSLPGGAQIPNGRARGFNDQIDVWLFPSPNHSLRYRQLNSQHKEIGFPFITPPFEPREQFNGFRRLDRYGARYEGREITTWLQRLAGGFYRQKYSFPDNNVVSTIDEGSSWKISGDAGSEEGAVPILTGDPSTFSPGSFTEGKSSVTSYGADLQATLARGTGAALTSGLVYLRDSSRDESSRFDLSGQVSRPSMTVAGRASNPDSVYENIGWLNLIEYEAARWLRVSAGFRLDNWKSEAGITKGFPLGTETAILDASLDALSESPGSINLQGLRGIGELVSGRAGISTSTTIATGNAGAVVRLRGGFNPY
ncbi:MAG TPA: carboxypeptidase regulatory-like domain-containing protein, partial [Blastocatellia bacterium]|nr:carboxypeptidase regulatory-like domain-containing protein [Blastocatellia bacterium]